MRESFSVTRAAERIRDYLLALDVPAHLGGQPRVEVEAVRPPLLRRAVGRLRALAAGGETPV